MKRRAFLRAFVVGLTVAAASTLWAEESEKGEKKEEYKPMADVTEILRDELAAIEGKEVTVHRVEFRPGWIGERHYHTGDVLVYVLEGKFIVDIDGGGRKVLGPGQVYHEAVNTVMRARNASTTEQTTIVIFQVGDKGEPLMIKAD
jgi:quercetin dioxygenase-like cupin family protein